MEKTISKNEDGVITETITPAPVIQTLSKQDLKDRRALLLQKLQAIQAEYDMCVADCDAVQADVDEEEVVEESPEEETPIEE